VALPSGPVPVEQRRVDIALRRGLDARPLAHWRAALARRRDLEAVLGAPVYRLVPGLAEHTPAARGPVPGDTQRATGQPM